jgi:antitoxin component of RelBE/YafQ-DinJ toxin-antitoxin module
MTTLSRMYVRLSPELKAKAEQVAKSFEMSLSDFVRWLLVEAVKEE